MLLLAELFSRDPGAPGRCSPQDHHHSAENMQTRSPASLDSHDNKSTEADDLGEPPAPLYDDAWQQSPPAVPAEPPRAQDAPKSSLQRTKDSPQKQCARAPVFRAFVGQVLEEFASVWAAYAAAWRLPDPDARELVARAALWTLLQREVRHAVWSELALDVERTKATSGSQGMPVPETPDGQQLPGKARQAPAKKPASSSSKKTVKANTAKPKRKKASSPANTSKDVPVASEAGSASRLRALGLMYPPPPLSWDTLCPLRSSPGPLTPFEPASDAPGRVPTVTGGRLANTVAARRSAGASKARTSPPFSHADLTLPLVRDILTTTCSLPLAWPLLTQGCEGSLGGSCSVWGGQKGRGDVGVHRPA